jgi:hypothetical protein
MARRTEESALHEGALELVERQRVSEDAKRFFGRTPHSIEILKGECGACAVVKVAMLDCIVEFIFNGGVLVGITPFPQRRGG